MKYAICNEMFELWNTEKGFDFERFCRFATECGYEGVEIAPFTLATDATEISQSRRKELRRIAETVGIEITGLHWLLAKTNRYHLTSPDPLIRKKTANYFLELVRLCADLGGKFMVLGSPNQRSLLPNVSMNEALQYAEEILLETVPLCEQLGVKIALEPLPPDETDFWNTAEQVVAFIEKLGTLNAKAPEFIALHLDCKAMCSESEPIPQIIHKNAKHVIYVHVNDPNRQGPGFGSLQYGPILAALREIGYAGWLSLEPFDYSPGVEVLAKKSIEYLKSL